VPRLLPLTIVLLSSASLLAALLTWASRPAEEPAGAPPPAVSHLLLRDALNRKQELKAEIAAGLAREQQTDDVAEEVAAGRLSLLEGAGRVRAVWRGMPAEVWNGLRLRIPAASDDERLCRMLIGKVQLTRWRDPGRAAVAARLAAELEEHLRRGPLKLPEPAA
jgi:hypothetical protein